MVANASKIIVPAGEKITVNADNSINGIIGLFGTLSELSALTVIFSPAGTVIFDAFATI